MPGPHPVELRERVVEAFDNGEGTHDELAARFAVGRSCVHRWVALARTTGSVQARPMGGARHERKVNEQGEELLRELLDVAPDTTIAELLTSYETEFGVRMDPRTMGRSVARIGYTRKRGLSGHRRPTGPT